MASSKVVKRKLEIERRYRHHSSQAAFQRYRGARNDYRRIRKEVQRNNEIIGKWLNILLLYGSIGLLKADYQIIDNHTEELGGKGCWKKL